MHLRATTVALLGSGLVIAGLAAPANAANYTVKLSFLGRTGEAQPTHATVVNLGSGKEYAVKAGKAVSLPKGSYGVGAYIRDDGDVTTIAARTVEVTKSQTLTFDARKGKKVSIKVADANARLTLAKVVPAAKTGNVSLTGTQPGGDPTLLVAPYVIPAPGIAMRVQAVLVDEKAAPPTRYDLANQLAPASSAVSLNFGKGDLARVEAGLYSSETVTSNDFRLTPRSANNTPLVSDFGFGVGDANLGPRFTSYRTPGYWSVSLTMRTKAGTLSTGQSLRKYTAGKAYTERFATGIWGFGSGLRGTVDSGDLYAGGRGIVAPASGGTLNGTTATWRLLDDKGKELAAGDNVSYRLPNKAAWYVLEATATRKTGATTSTTVLGRWRVKADGSQDYGGPLGLGRFTLAGDNLDRVKSVPRSSSTVLTVGTKDLKDVSSVVVEYSTDGKTWTKVKTAKSGSQWKATGKNPGKAGSVSVRTTATTKSGASAKQTVKDAYRVK
ncbi:MAG: hypothetical protein ACT4QG_02305 [Sporichthyaceae bacterium]